MESERSRVLFSTAAVCTNEAAYGREIGSGAETTMGRKRCQSATCVDLWLWALCVGRQGKRARKGMKKRDASGRHGILKKPFQIHLFSLAKPIRPAAVSSQTPISHHSARCDHSDGRHFPYEEKDRHWASSIASAVVPRQCAHQIQVLPFNSSEFRPGSLNSGTPTSHSSYPPLSLSGGSGGLVGVWSVSCAGTTGLFLK